MWNGGAVPISLLIPLKRDGISSPMKMCVQWPNPHQYGVDHRRVTAVIPSSGAKAGKDRVAELLQTLVALGQARETTPGLFVGYIGILFCYIP